MSAASLPQPPHGLARVYLDHAASTPVRPEVAEQVAHDLREGLGSANPAALHRAGQDAGALLADARARIAAVLGADTHEVLFTSGGTESCALAVSGAVLAAKQRGVEQPVLLTGATEHPAVSQTARQADRWGARLHVVPANEAGQTTPEALVTALDDVTDLSEIALVSMMTANNETGVLNDLPALADVLRQAEASSGDGALRPNTHHNSADLASSVPRPGRIPLHTDAIATAGQLPLNFHAADLDALSLAGHKLGAPHGSGILLARRDLSLISPLAGGGQERGIRSGTQDVIAARALALALELTEADRERLSRQLTELSTELFAGLLAHPGVHATLPENTPRLPGTVHVWCEDAEAEALVMSLDLAGIDASAGSACHAGVTQPSEVLLASGFSPEAARGTLRLTLGWNSTPSDIDALLTAFPSALESARRAHEAATRTRPSATR